MKSIVFCTVLAAALSLAVPAAAQTTCIYLPSDSPVVSTSVDDIPAGSPNYYVWPAGTSMPLRANHRIAIAQISENEQRVYYAVDATLGTGHIYYNRRFRANSSSPWYWQYSQSVATSSVITGIGMPGTVLYSPTAKYGNGFPLYKYAMYGVNQPWDCNGPMAGVVMVSFSNDGICWTTPVPASGPHGNEDNCAPQFLGAEMAEMVAAIDTGSFVALMVMRGDNVNLAYNVDMNTSGAYLLWASYYSMGSLANYMAAPSTSEVSSNGLFRPLAATNMCSPDRFRSYGYLENLDAAYDPVTGYLYMSRGYPYPFDRGWVTGTACPDTPGPLTPSCGQTTEYFYNGANIEGCAASPAIYPNRLQIYRMYIGPLTSLGTVTTGTWTLISDVGNSAGYTLNGCTNQPLVTGQTNVGRDWGTATFLRDGVGNVVVENGNVVYYAGDTFRMTKSIGPCRTTGAERLLQQTTPR
jgi:hypothetical protein